MKVLDSLKNKAKEVFEFIKLHAKNPLKALFAILYGSIFIALLFFIPIWGIFNILGDITLWEAFWITYFVSIVKNLPTIKSK